MIESLNCCFSHVTNLEPAKTRVREVFADEFYRDCSQTMDFFALDCVPPCKISATLQIINKHFPVDSSYNFLKKIRNGCILIAPVNENLSERLDALIVTLGSSGILAHEMHVTKTPVPKYPVLTHAQYSKANKIWPIRVTTPLVDELHEPDAIATQKICNRLNSLIERQSSHNAGKCMFVSPNDDQVYAGLSDIDHAPLRHAVFDACGELGKTSDYLATGFKVFALGEPCLMCSMALLHSRVAEVYFVHQKGETKKFHGLGGTLSVHCNSKLNHRFRVFRVCQIIE